MGASAGPAGDAAGSARVLAGPQVLLFARLLKRFFPTMRELGEPWNRASAPGPVSLAVTGGRALRLAAGWTRAAICWRTEYRLSLIALSCTRERDLPRLKSLASVERSSPGVLAFAVTLLAPPPAPWAGAKPYAASPISAIRPIRRTHRAAEYLIAISVLLRSVRNHGQLPLSYDPVTRQVFSRRDRPDMPG